MNFKEVWNEQQELNKLGQNIGKLQAFRLYSYGYNQALKLLEKVEE